MKVKESHHDCPPKSGLQTLAASAPVNRTCPKRRHCGTGNAGFFEEV